MILLRGGRLVNVFTGETYAADVALDGPTIVGVGSDLSGSGQVIDCRGKFIAPGLIDGHIHVESSMLSPPGFAEAVVPHGTTTTVSDPHEIGNVLGIPGVDYMLRASDDIPLTIYFMAPSCVPATDMETSGATLAASDIVAMLGRKRVLGVAEMMNYPGVYLGIPNVLAKVDAGIAARRVVDGHAPGLVGDLLQKYLAAGIETDHECFSLAEAEEKLRLGVHILIREGSAARNLEALLPLVSDANYTRFSFVCDDHYPDALLRDGHIDDVLRRAVARGMDPIRAVQLATINTARCYNLRHPETGRRLGGVAPGWHADIVVFDDLTSFEADRVIKDGQVVAARGAMTVEVPKLDDPSVRGTFHVAPLSSDSFRVPARPGKIRAMGVIENQLVTRHHFAPPRVVGGEVVADVENDLLKIASVERHKKTGNIGLGFIQGFGLRRGALAVSVGHDSHNITVVGTSDADMRAAVEAVVALDGGCVAVAEGKVIASLALPVAGLMSVAPLADAVADLDRLNSAAADLGCRLPSPFITLSFMPLAVIPSLKITDRGMVDVDAFKLVDLFVA